MDRVYKEVYDLFIIDKEEALNESF